MQTALRWVQLGISAFGGDPSRVTVFGQSAGGESSCDLLVRPRAGPLFHRLICESGPLHRASLFSPLDQLDPVYRRLVSALGCAGAGFSGSELVACLRAAPWDRVLNVSVALRLEEAGAASPLGVYGPAVDGVELRGHPARLVEAGAFHAGKALLAGSNRDEQLPRVLTQMPRPLSAADSAAPAAQEAMLSWVRPSRVAMDDAAARDMCALYTAAAMPELCSTAAADPAGDVRVRAGTGASTSGSDADADADCRPLVAAPMNDVMYECGTRRLFRSWVQWEGADAAFRYRFGLGLLCNGTDPLYDGGVSTQTFGGRVSAHTYEIPFVFDTLLADSGSDSDSPAVGSFPCVWTAAQRRVALAMVRYWTCFAATGRPSHHSCQGAALLTEWPAFGERGLVLHIGSEFVVETPSQDARAAVACDFWDGLQAAGARVYY